MNGWVKLRSLLTVLCLCSANAAGADTIADFTEVPPPDIVSIQVGSVPSVLRVGDTSQLEVTGTFVDGEERDITSNRYTFYTPEPEAIVAVSDEGLIEALAVGSVAVMVSHVQASGALAFHQLELEVHPEADESTDPPVQDRDKKER